MLETLSKGQALALVEICKKYDIVVVRQRLIAAEMTPRNVLDAWETYVTAAALNSEDLARHAVGRFDCGLSELGSSFPSYAQAQQLEQKWLLALTGVSNMVRHVTRSVVCVLTDARRHAPQGLGDTLMPCHLGMGPHLGERIHHRATTACAVDHARVTTVVYRGRGIRYNVSEEKRVPPGEIGPS